MNDGLKVVASLAATGLFLTVGWQYAVRAVLGGHVEQAAQNVDALKTVSQLDPPLPAPKVGQPAAARPSPPPAAQPAPAASSAGWQADSSWGPAATSSPPSR